MKENYAFFVGRGDVSTSLRGAISFSRGFGHPLYSARLGTGLLGKIDCPSGRRGPAGRNEVILALGGSGLSRLVEFGFTTCPTCLPEDSEEFWESIKGTVKIKYGIDSLDDFTDKSVLPFDARRVDWETIVPITRAFPNLLYVPKGLDEFELDSMRTRFTSIGVPLPRIGYYDGDAPDAFAGYD